MSVVHALDFSPRIGFIHSGCPLSFVYDLADLYKPEVSIDLAFSLTKKMGGDYVKEVVADAFRERICSNNILERSVKDLEMLMGVNK